MLSGHHDPAHAWVDFRRAHADADYVKHIADNIAYGKAHGLKLWTTTELHTSLQTEARNYCRIKHGDPSRAPQPTDLIEWIASWIDGGQIDKILDAKTLRGAYEATTSIRGVGPYYAGNPVMMIAALPEASYSHMEPFCAPGGGALKSLEYLFGKKFGWEPAVKAIAWLFENQAELLPNIAVPAEFRNMELPNGNMLFKSEQDKYTCNSFEVGLCQFSVYCKFLEEPEAMLRRKNPPMPDFAPLKERLEGNPRPLPGKVKKTEPAVTTALNLLDFD